MFNAHLDAAGDARAERTRAHRFPHRQHQRRFRHRVQHAAPQKKHFADALTYPAEQIIEQGDLINHMFWAVVEATEEAVLNSLFKADTMIGRDDRVVPGLPIEETVALMNKYGRKEVRLP